MSAHVFVDETKQRGYLLVASLVVPSDLDSIRRMLRGLVLPDQRRLHIKDENDQRRRSIATAIAVSGVTATIYDAGRRYRNERQRRAACLHALVGDAARRGAAMLGVDLDHRAGGGPGGRASNKTTPCSAGTTSAPSSSPARPAAATPTS